MTKNILIVHYNTPYMTECLVRSINMFVKNAIIYIFDNSDKLPFTAEFKNVIVIDNTKGQIIDFDKWLEKYPEKVKTSAGRNGYGSAKHAYSVQKCMELIDDNFVLLDSDILLKKDISDIFDNKYVFIGSTEIWKAKTGIAKYSRERAIPYLCYINTKKCNEFGIKYFDEKRIYGLTQNGDNYDTGASFFEDIKINKLKLKKIILSDFIEHYKAGSWIDDAKTYDNYNPISFDAWLEKNKKLWCKSEKFNNKKVVYTCITGDYDILKDPSKVSLGFDYICFTDNSTIKSNVWDIRSLPDGLENLSDVKKQRYIKINPHLFLKDYELSIWIDGNVSLKGDLNSFISENIKENDISIYVPEHPSRRCIYKEAMAVISMKKDKPDIINPQMNRYKKEGFPENYGLLQSNILVRYHNNTSCIKLMEYWSNEVMNGSHRDQLSFNYASWKNNDVKIKYLDKNIYKSLWFDWKTIHMKKNISTKNKKQRNKKLFNSFIYHKKIQDSIMYDSFNQY